MTRLLDLQESLLEAYVRVTVDLPADALEAGVALEISAVLKQEADLGQKMTVFFGA